MNDLLKQYIRNFIKEAKSPDTVLVANLIVSAAADSGVEGLQVKVASDKEIRLAPSTSHLFSGEEIAKILKKARIKLLDSIPKGDPGSLSGRFTTYIVNHGGKQYNVLFTSGRNKGQVFEDEVASEAQDLKSGKISPRIASLLKAIGINPNNIKDSEQTGGKNNARPLLPEVPNVGPIISDLTLILKRPDSAGNAESGKKVFISLKDPSGNTFANTGYVGGFVQDEDKKTGEPIVKSGSHPTDDFLRALGINKTLAARGLTNYLRGTPSSVTKTPASRFSSKDPEMSKDVAPSGTQDYEKVQRYLASGYGYGYWYARDMGGGKWHVEKIENQEHALELVGVVKRIDISYPGTTKQISCRILTTKGRYVVEVRNTQGKIVPNQVNIRVG